MSSQEGTCQGDPLAMAIYAAAITPLIKSLGEACPSTTQCWYADDDGAADNLRTLRKYWDELLTLGPGYGYYPNAIKTILLTRPELHTEADHLFSGTGVTIRSDGCRYLGGGIGTAAFCCSYLESLVKKWREQIRVLCGFAETQPHAAYTVFIKGLAAQWKYHIRTTECPPDIFSTLDLLINTALLPAFTGREFTPDQPERTLLSLPARLGGLAIPSLVGTATSEFKASQTVTLPLVELIAPNDLQSDDTLAERLKSAASTVVRTIAVCRAEKKKERCAKERAMQGTVEALKNSVSKSQAFLLNIAEEKGVSSWLTCDPSLEFKTVLNKSDFRDAVCLRYGFPLDGLPSDCVCGHELTTSHALSCPSGGYPTARHNEVRDVIADAMRSVCRDVETEPELLPFDNEDLAGRTTNRSLDARVDICVPGFWTRQQPAYFDIRVTHTEAGLMSVKEARKHLERHEREKKRQYCERVNVIDRGTFTPLVFSTSGMAGQECGRLLKAIAADIVEKNSDLHYSHVLNRLRCKISFCLLRWNITCFRGCRASYKRRSTGFVTECRQTASTS